MTGELLKCPPKVSPRVWDIAQQCCGDEQHAWQVLEDNGLHESKHRDQLARALDVIKKHSVIAVVQPRQREPVPLIRQEHATVPELSADELMRKLRWTYEEVAFLTRLCTRTIRRRVDDKTFPSPVRFGSKKRFSEKLQREQLTGGRLLFERDQVLKWIDDENTKGQ